MGSAAQRAVHERRGRFIASLLSAAIARGNAPPLPDAHEDEAALSSLLVKSGAGPLAWWASRDVSLWSEDRLEELHDTYRMQAIRVALAELQLEALFAAFDSNGVTPILGKGWAVARAYPDVALRPYGDFDVYVDEAEHATVERLVAEMPLHGFSVDVHRGASYLGDRAFGELLSRSVRIPLGATSVRVFAADDQLRLSCLHALAEGMIRPPWLCDIAFLLEASGAEFDWDRFRSGDPRKTNWAFAAIGLAHRILGADITSVPDVRTVRTQPRWLTDTVIRVWGAGPLAKGSRMTMTDALATGGFRRELFARWPNAIEATLGVNGRLNALPRLPFQIADAVRRTAGFLRRKHLR